MWELAWYKHLDIMMDMQNVIITAVESPTGGLDALAGRLEKQGLHVGQVFSYGVITGSVSSRKLPMLHNVSGVEDIQTEQSFRLPHADSLIQ